MAPKNQQGNIEQPKEQKRDNPRPFIKYEKITQPVIDDDTKQVRINPKTGKPVEAVVGYKPLLRKGGLTEEILDTGDLNTLEKFWEDHEDDLNEPEKAYMEARLKTAREVKRLGDASKADLAEGKTAPRPEPDEKDGFVGFSDLKYPGKQTSGNGCWSCSYSLLLKSRGIDLSQEKIRAWRPDRTKDTTKKSKDKGIQRKRNAASFRMNTDGVNGLMENADLLGQVLPNESMEQVTMKPLVRDELFVDGQPVTTPQYNTILKHYKSEMKAKLTDQIRQAIQVNKSPVALSIDGHFVTITGISKDGNTIRYEDSLPASGKLTNTMTMDELVHRATEQHKSWGGHTVGPSGLSLTWIKDINVPEYEKRTEEKPVLHAEEPGLVKLDENGKVTVDVPTTHESANAMGEMAAGQIEGKGVSNPVTMKQEELTKLMGGKPFFSIGIGGGYTMGYADVYYPGRIYYKKDPTLAYEGLAGEEAEKLFSDLEDTLGGVIQNAEKNEKAGAWTEQLKEYNKAIRVLRDYAGEPEDPENQKALPEAVKKLKELPDFLASKEGEQTVYQHMTENMLPVYRAAGIKNLLKLDDTLSLGTDFEQLMGVGKAIHPNDVDYREDRNLDWLAIAQLTDRDNITQKMYTQIFSKILAREELRAEKIAAGDKHPDISEAELGERAAKIRESGGFRKLMESDAIYELAAGKDTDRLQKAYEDAVLAAAQDAPKAEEMKQEGPKAGNQQKEENQAGSKAQEPKEENREAEDESAEKESAEKESEPVTAPPEEPAEKKDIKEKYTLFDVNQGQWMGGSVLFGALGDAMTDKEKASAYKKITILNLLEDDPAESPKIYGQKYQELAQDLAENAENMRVRDQGPKRSMIVKSGIYDHYVDDRVDAPLKTFQEGMREIGAAMEKKSQTFFNSPAEENYFRVMKGFVDDINNGTFSKKYLENPVYEYAQNMTGKIRTTAPDGTVKEKDGKAVFNIHFGQKIDDYKNMRILQETGMLEAMAGGVKVTEMLEEHINGGDTGREELAAEYRLQQKRMEKALSITKDKFDELKSQRVFDNDYEEFAADGARSYGYAMEDAKGRADLLEAGYPASDLAAISPFIRNMASVMRDARVAQKELEEKQAKYDEDRLKLEQDQKNLQGKELEDRKAKLAEDKAKLDQSKAALDQKLENQKTMQDSWKKLTNTSGHLTTQERREKLQEFHDNVAAMQGRVNIDNQLDIAESRLEQRIGAKLSYPEQALMAQKAGDLYRIIDDKTVDPRLMRSSDQFKKFKEELKNLAEMEKELDPTDKYEVARYQKQAAKVVQAGSDYLRYKTKQLNGSAHDRSKTEALRVSVVDAVVSNLKTGKVPGTEDRMLQKNAKPLGITLTDAGDRVLTPKQIENLPVNYDSYIRLHTGRAAANGSKEEMIEDLSKVMAAQMLKNSKNQESFDLNKIHKYAQQMKSKFDLEGLDQEALSRYLSSPADLKKGMLEIRNINYGIKEGVEYEEYLDKMRELYQQMSAPTGDGPYKKLYEQVEKVAHLPEDLEGIDQEKLKAIVESANFEIMQNAEKCAVEHALDKGNEKGLNGPAGEALDAFSVLSDLVATGNARFENTVQKVNKKRGTMDWEDEYLGVGYGGMAKIDPEDYGADNFGEEVRELDENKKKVMLQTVQKSLTERMKDALTDAKEAVNAAEQKALKGAVKDAKEAIRGETKPKEAPEGSNRPTLDEAANKADSKKQETQKKDAKKEEKKSEEKIKRSNTIGL